MLLKLTKFVLVFIIFIGVSVTTTANYNETIETTTASSNEIVENTTANSNEVVEMKATNIDLRPPVVNEDNLDIETLELLAQPYRDVIKKINSEYGKEIVRIDDEDSFEGLLGFYYSVKNLSADEFEVKVREFIDKASSII